MVAFKISHLQIPDFSNTTPNVFEHEKYHTYAMVLLKYHTSYDYEHASCHTINMVAFKISHLQIPDFLNTTPNVC
jgi:hypothetical protein